MKHALDTGATVQDAGGPVEIARAIRWSGLGRERVFADRISPLLEVARGKRVLDIGCAGSDALTSVDPVHGRIARAASSSVGIDIFEPGVRRLAERGHRVFTASAEDFDLPEKDFELATLGDVIEHVSNPGKVFESVNRHLVPGGLLAVTTPNPFSITLMLKMILRRPYAVNSQHVFWFDPALLAGLLGRSGFEIVELWWIEKSRFAPLRWLQRWHRPFHGTFGLLARKTADAVPTSEAAARPR